MDSGLDQAKAASSPTSGAGELAGKPVWREQGTFEESERARRSAHGHTPKEKAFFSHCWRDPETQVKKRRIIDHFSAPKEVSCCRRSNSTLRDGRASSEMLRFH